MFDVTLVGLFNFPMGVRLCLTRPNLLGTGAWPYFTIYPYVVSLVVRCWNLDLAWMVDLLHPCSATEPLLQIRRKHSGFGRSLKTLFNYVNITFICHGYYWIFQLIEAEENFYWVLSCHKYRF